MSCPEHPQWIHDREDCPFCVAKELRSPVQDKVMIDKMRIRAELNLLQALLYDLYVGKEEFTSINWKNISNRIQSIRNQVAE